MIINFFKKYSRKEINKIESCYILGENSSPEQVFGQIIHLEAERVLKRNSRALYKHGEKEIIVEEYVQLSIDPNTLFLDSNVYFRLFSITKEGLNHPIENDFDLAYLTANMKKIFLNGVNLNNRRLEKFGSIDSINYVNREKRVFYLNVIDFCSSKRLSPLYYLYTKGIGKGYPDLIGKNIVYEVKSVNDKLHDTQIQFNYFYKEYFGYETRLVEIDDANKDSLDYVLFFSTVRKEKREELKNNRILRELFDYPLRLSQFKTCNNIIPKPYFTDLANNKEFYLDFLGKEVKQYCSEDVFNKIFSQIEKELNDYYEMKERSKIQEIAEPVLEEYRYALNHYNKNIKSLKPDCIIPLQNVLDKIKLNSNFYEKYYCLQLLVIVDKLSNYYKKINDKRKCNKLCEWVLMIPEGEGYTSDPTYRRINSRKNWSKT